MPSSTIAHTPSLATFLKSLKSNKVETSIELFVSLLKGRQIRNSRQCALATTHLLLTVVARERIRDAQKLIERIRSVGRRLVAAQPKELAVGNIVRRILGVVREVAEEDVDSQIDSDNMSIGTPTTPIPGEVRSRPSLPKTFSEFTPLHGAAALPENMQMGIHPSPPGTSEGSDPDARPQRPPLMSSATSYAAPGPSLDALAGLLERVSARVGRGYSVMGRDHVWLGELLVFAVARRFAAHWRAGEVRPREPMGRYVRGEVGALAAATEAKVQGEGARWFAHAGLTAVRGIQMFFTQLDRDRFLMHDDEIAEVVAQWEACECVPAEQRV